MAEAQGVEAVVTEESPAKARVAPFLRWAGGKRWLVPHVLQLLGGDTVNRYHEPFLGGGSVFFALDPKEEIFLSDLNTDLITVYRHVRDDPARVAKLLEGYENTAECYYRARANKPTAGDELAAWFIFLNHTSFNGIFRVNRAGEYNVPFGHRRSTNIPDKDWLERAGRRLQGTTLRGLSFETALGDVQEGDLVFLDPPYTVAHNNNGFVRYNQHLFSFDDQKLLAQSIKKISDQGARYILTNAAHQSIHDLFSPLGNVVRVARKNSIGGLKANRGSVDEYVFTNIDTK